jgi:hypothetical protein
VNLAAVDRFVDLLGKVFPNRIHKQKDDECWWWIGRRDSVCNTCRSGWN